MFDYLFIDLDGPILETKLRHYWVFNSALTKLGLETNLDSELYWELKRNKTPLNEILKLNLTSNKYHKELSIELLNLIESLEALDKDIIKTGAQDFLNNARFYFKHVCLVTLRRNKRNTLAQLERLDLTQYFDSVVIPEVTSNNPKYNALKNISFNTALFIGDTEEDFITAKKLGIKSVGILNGIRVKKLMSADIYFEELRDIDIVGFLDLK